MINKNFKILKIDHIAIAVNSNKTGSEIFNLLGMNIGVSELVDSEKVNVVKVSTEDKGHAIELLEASDNSSTITKFISKKGQGLHHIALEVDNIKEAINYLKANHVQLIYNSPKIGANNKLITFIHPNSTPGILLELCQSAP